MGAELELMREAEENTGLSDFAEIDGFRTGLRILLAELEKSKMPDESKKALRSLWRARLETRLKLVALRKAKPEIAAQEIEGPLVVTGLPRTGTTSLIDLLAQDPATRAPLAWELDNLFPPPTPATWHEDPRIDEYDEALRARADPVHTGGLHIYGARLPEECGVFQVLGFWGSRFPGEPEAVHLGGAAEWIRWCTPPRPYAVHKWVLQHLQAHGSKGRWTLKNPAHIFAIGELVAEYPGAMIVQTHRDPQSLFPSICGLVAIMRGQGPGDPRRRDTARYLLQRWGAGIQRCLAARLDPDVDARIFDIPQRQIIRDPMGTVKAIYAHFDLAISREAERTMARWIEHPAQHQSKARFKLDDFDLTPDDVEAAMGPYRNRFGAFF